jgi:hypothetical protein
MVSKPVVSEERQVAPNWESDGKKSTKELAALFDLWNYSKYDEPDERR